MKKILTTVASAFFLCGTGMISCTKPLLPTPPASEQLIADAGTDQLITLPSNSVLLDGTASEVADGYAVSFLRAEVSGPSNATIETPAGVRTIAKNLVAGIYEFQLTVTCNRTRTASDVVKVEVHRAGG